MKKIAVFSWWNYEAQGGINDLDQVFANVSEAVDSVKERAAFDRHVGVGHKEYQVANLETREILYTSSGGNISEYLPVDG